MVEYKKDKIENRQFFTVTDDFDVKKCEAEEKKAEENKRKFDGLYEKYLNIGFYLITPLILGVFLGLYLDSRFAVKPFFTLSGIGLGIVCTFYNLWKLTKE